MRNRVSVYIFSIFVLASSVGAVLAQTPGHDLEPVVILGDTFAEFLGAGVTEENNELFLYAYKNSAWEQIPFQIDEIGWQGDTVSGYFIPDDGLLDADDEFSFMAKDAGEKADESWIGDEDSQSHSRYELVLKDPLDTNNTSWAYLYRSAPGAPGAADVDYVAYHTGPNESAGADTIVGQTYTMANAANNGFPNFLSFSGADINILKLQEIKLLAGAFDLNETDSFLFQDVQVKDGNIRVVREMKIDIGIVLFPGVPIFVPDAFKGITFPLFYYANSLELRASFSIPDTLPLNLEINKLRQSFNLNENAVGMKMFTKNNTGIIVDGTVDSIVDGITNYPDETTWLAYSGDPGNFVNLYTIPDIGSEQILFYEDDASAGSYGNGGFQLSGEGEGRIRGQAPLGLTSYYPGTVAQGDEQRLGNTLANPLVVSKIHQTFEQVTSVEVLEDGVLPERFTLGQNFPNPFNPTTQIRYGIPATSKGAHRTVLTIYNLLGQPMRTLVDAIQGAGNYLVTWNGMDDQGRTVPSGVYIYRLASGEFGDSRKLVLVK